jgi:hypothetical protein
LFKQTHKEGMGNVSVDASVPKSSSSSSSTAFGVATPPPSVTLLPLGGAVVENKTNKAERDQELDKVTRTPAASKLIFELCLFVVFLFCFYTHIEPTGNAGKKPTLKRSHKQFPVKPIPTEPIEYESDYDDMPDMQHSSDEEGEEEEAPSMVSQAYRNKKRKTAKVARARSPTRK